MCGEAASNIMPQVYGTAYWRTWELQTMLMFLKAVSRPTFLIWLVTNIPFLSREGEMVGRDFVFTL